MTGDTPDGLVTPVPSAALDYGRLAGFARSYLGSDEDVRGAADLELDVRPLPGGLQAPAVAEVQVRLIEADGRSRTRTFVAKHLKGPTLREAEVYRSLLSRAATPAPRLLGVDPISDTDSYLYLERIVPAHQWPWSEVTLIGTVLEQLAALHQAVPPHLYPEALASWDYEAELLASAQTTVELLDATVRHPEVGEHAASLQRGRVALRRLVGALPEVRRQLLAAAPFGTAFLHGDVHTGNVLLRTRDDRREVVFLDWGRARLGSPLEDVSSWLQSLGYWEPEAAQRHDTLLRRYLRARGYAEELSRVLRDAYWLAGACNVLAGALRYHLALVHGWGAATPRMRSAAVRAARDALRIIRRADACWSG